MTYAEAMARYGSDKPDLRFGVELVDLTDFSGTEFRVFQARGHVGAVVMRRCGADPQGAGRLAGPGQGRGAKGARLRRARRRDRRARGPVAKNLRRGAPAGLADAVGAKPGDAVFFAAADAAATRRTCSARPGIEIGQRRAERPRAAWAFLWIVDAPMFEPALRRVGDGAGWTAVHHPFTSPNGEWMDTFEDEPGEALAYAYDIVCNGNEIGGGSIRIHRRDVQQRVFDLLGITDEEAEDKFGFLLEAFQYGPPPHGGIAFGWDRVHAAGRGRRHPRRDRVPQDSPPPPPPTPPPPPPPPGTGSQSWERLRKSTAGSLRTPSWAHHCWGCAGARPPGPSRRVNRVPAPGPRYLVVRAAIEEATLLGERLIVVLGDPRYYARFGFGSAADAGVIAPWTGPAPRVLALPAYDGEPAAKPSTWPPIRRRPATCPRWAVGGRRYRRERGADQPVRRGRRGCGTRGRASRRPDAPAQPGRDRRSIPPARRRITAALPGREQGPDAVLSRCHPR